MLNEQTHFKILNLNRTAIWGKGGWPPIGEWYPNIQYSLEPCSNGLHITTGKDLAYWLQESFTLEAEIYTVECYIPKQHHWWVKEHPKKLVVRKARLTKKLNYDATTFLYILLRESYPSQVQAINLCEQGQSYKLPDLDTFLADWLYRVKDSSTTITNIYQVKQLCHISDKKITALLLDYLNKENPDA